MEEISFDEFKKIDLRVAEIKKVEAHPNADKLMILDVDLGKEKRQLVAGLKDYYKDEELLNKKIIVVTNLKTAKLRGIESKGMLLAAEKNKEVGILTIKDAEPGEICNFGNLKNSAKEISFDDFLKLKIVAKDGRVFYGNEELKANQESVSVERVKDGKVR